MHVKNIARSLRRWVEIDLLFAVERTMRRFRPLIGILAVLLGALIGWQVWSFAGAFIGSMIIIAFYWVVIGLVQQPGFIREDEGLFFGIVTGMFGGVGMFSLYAPLTFSNVVAMAIIGGALGFIYAKGNILYYQASEPL